MIYVFEIPELPRPKKRLTELLYKTAQNPPAESGSSSGKYCRIKFLRSPLSIEPAAGGKRLQMTFGINELDPQSERVRGSGQTEVEICDVVFRSVGYKGRRLFTEVPFDEDKGIIPNNNGKVQPGKIISIERN